MCGIAGIILKNSSTFPVMQTLLHMSKAIKHRGPDGEGFLAITNENITPLSTPDTPGFSGTNIPYLPQKSYSSVETEPMACFAHRRLSILDLEDTGHQPMCDATQNLWISFNGEIYNYKELKEELIKHGYRFISNTDTEVVLNAYLHWGKDCLQKFNGMWAFCIYDKRTRHFFASRDNLGVKPFYFVHNEHILAFASEQKAFVKSGLIRAQFSEEQAIRYLTSNELEYQSANFFTGVEELWPGNFLEYNAITKEFKISPYFNSHALETMKHESLGDEELISKIRTALEKNIEWRLRSDVEVGTCLSGGLDSSIIAGIMATKTKLPVSCFTAAFTKGAKNELPFAKLVTQHIKGKHFVTEPTAEEFEKDFETLLYALDAPIWDTSTYAQYRVMQLASENNIKVVLDGQGADELFAGYHHHFLAYWKQVKKEDGILSAFKTIAQADKSIRNPFIFMGKQYVKETLNVSNKAVGQILNPEIASGYKTNKSIQIFDNLNHQLIDDMGAKRLKSFLRCEDRCGMWHSVESRTPFSDDMELISLLFSFNGKRKIQNGTSKYLLREAAKNYIPQEIYNRYDKVGFETPMNTWINKLLPKITSDLRDSKQTFVNKSCLNKQAYSQNEIKLLFKLYVLTKWETVFNVVNDAKPSQTFL
jgi:asparagine synthase (glutamine-hydrolysing)